MPKSQPSVVSAVLAGLVRYKLLIRGLPPGLMFQGKGKMLWDQEHAGTKASKKLSRDDEARLLCHWMPDEKVAGLPAVMLYKSVCKAASGHKIGRKSATSIVASTIAFADPVYPLTPAAPETFVDWVRIPPRTGAMVQIGRPLFREWACELVLTVDGEEYKGAPDQLLRPIVRDAGKLVGIGANRPELKGPNGRFVVEEFVQI